MMVLAAQDPKTTHVLGSEGPGPCQPGPLGGRGIAAGQLGLELECSPCGKIELELRRT